MYGLRVDYMESMMSHQYKYAALAAAVALAWGTANAQSAERTERTTEFSQSLRYGDYLKGADLRASELVGARVRNAEGDSLGEIEEIVIPSRDQDDMLVIVSVGGLADIGDKLVALPYEDLRVSLDGDTFYFDRTEAQLKAAPAFTYKAQAEAQTRSQQQVDRDARVDRDTDRDTRVDRDARVNRDAQVDRDARIDRDADRDTQVDRDARVERDTDRDARVDRDTRAPAATARTATDPPRTTAPNATAAAKSANVVLDVFDYRASDLIGATVLDDRGESVGKIDDIVVSTEDDKLHAVIAIGGFVGFGAKLLSMPFDALQITSDGDAPQVRIAMTGDQLTQLVESRPEFRYERQLAQTPANAPRG
jgi:sporulation protein YlmC with PRC-barrel domain